MRQVNRHCMHMRQHTHTLSHTHTHTHTHTHIHDRWGGGTMQGRAGKQPSASTARSSRRRRGTELGALLGHTTTRNGEGGTISVPAIVWEGCLRFRFRGLLGDALLTLPPNCCQFSIQAGCIVVPDVSVLELPTASLEALAYPVPAFPDAALPSWSRLRLPLSLPEADPSSSSGAASQSSSLCGGRLPCCCIIVSQTRFVMRVSSKKRYLS